MIKHRDGSVTLSSSEWEFIKQALGPAVDEILDDLDVEED